VRSSLRLAAALCALLALALAGAPAAPAGGRTAPYVDPQQFSSLPFGSRSHWLQPWRAWLDTRPGSAVSAALGIQFDADPREAEATAAVLARAGFRRARIEIGWSQLSYEDPRRLHRPEELHATIGALRRHGLRPLVLLNANHGIPGPALRHELRLTRPAPAGARTVRLDASSAAAVVPGLTGLDEGDRGAAVLVDRVAADGTAQLSRPLPSGRAAGAHRATTLRYAPFAPPRRPDGSPNPEFEATLRGWLDYVGTVTRTVRDLLGSTAFDVEVWNELSFGSDFLDASRYRDPAPAGSGDVPSVLLERTVRYLRDPANGVAGIGISNGLASETPFASPATSPAGLTAMSKHLYRRLQRFPADQGVDAIRPVDALGRTSYTTREPDDGRDPPRYDRFVPRYDAFLPEYAMTGIQTETLLHDLAPGAHDIYGTPHGRDVRFPGGRRPAQVWVTETNLDVSAVAETVDEAARRRLHAKAALRGIVAWVSKGVTAYHLFSARDDSGLDLVQPGVPDGGPAMVALGRLTAALRPPGRVGRIRPISVAEVATSHDRRQFDGDGTAAHPPLADRDVVAAFPFQLAPSRHVVAAYVMTRNLARRRPGSGPADPRRFDLAPARYRLRLTGVARGARATATDPLTGERVPVSARRVAGGDVVVSVSLTDSPRLIDLTARPRPRPARARGRRRGR
jgi:hypothetical protein